MFEVLEQRVNSGALAKLSNATALINAVEVKGIFDNESAVANLGLAGFESTNPQFTAATDDLPNVAQGNSVVIGAVTYKVASVEPDGTGITVLQLKK